MPAWLNRLFRRSSSAEGARGHITFGATSVGRTITRAGLLLKKQIWIWPIIAVVVLATVGYGIRVAIERTIQNNLRSELQTLVNIERAMLETWLKIQESNAESLANDPQVREIVGKLLEAAQPAIDEAGEPATPDSRPANQSGLSAQLANELGPGMSSHKFAGFVVVDKQAQVLSASNKELIGQSVPQDMESTLARALSGQSTVSAPFPSITTLKDELGRMHAGVPTMHALAPIRDPNFQVVAVLALRIRPEQEFTRILQLGTVGESGETYAIDKRGTFISNSRFDESLILLGLLPDNDNSRSMLQLSARDPGGNIKEGFRPSVRRAELPLTKSAAAAIAGTSGVDLEGYRDYRGVPVVGAWHWLPDYDIGLITEIDHAEAYRPLAILQWAFFTIFALLILSSVAIFVFTLVVARLRREAQKAVIEAKHLGQYRLEERIGAGAMGVVYKGHHAMLRRPTAIKMLNLDKLNEASAQRFEREVQITCKLNHPNTVAIYDYGRTPEGVFYYAMEYLDGIDLQALVERYGPQPEGRVVRILKQICGSLYEAHSLGLVHRDIKPANVMLNRRGGEPDVVKVLDFGLVKALDEEQQTGQSGGLSGTPLYMSPEAIQTPDLVDARSDLYAVGAIGYFLITGQPVFRANTLIDLCQRHVTSMPDTPTQRLGRPVSPELESALLGCLEKSRAKRPQTARDLAILLDRVVCTTWSMEESEAWWGRHERTQFTVAGGMAMGGTGGNGGNAPDGPPVNGGPPSSAGGSPPTSHGGFEQTMAIDQPK